jgi:hypothetical protein
VKIDLTDYSNDLYEDFVSEISGLSDIQLKKLKNQVNILDGLIWQEINYRAEIRLKKISSSPITKSDDSKVQNI